MHKIIKKIKKKASFKRGYRPHFIELDEIFLDSKNLPQFDTQQFEGTLESPIKRRALITVGVTFCLIIVLFGSRLWFLQVANGATYKQLSENNSLSQEPIFASRGNIYDRNNVPLAWNGTATDDAPWGTREYIAEAGFSHLLANEHCGKGRSRESF